MIDISLYRCRIGRFSQKVLKIKLPRYILESQKLNKKSKWGFGCFIKLVKLLLLISTTFLILDSSGLNQNFRGEKQNPRSTFMSTSWKNYSRAHDSSMLTGNFFARYLYGNKKLSAKGVKAYHLNIRSLQNKVGEIKKITKEIKMHLIGLSECELKKNNNIDQLEKLKVPGYKLLLHKSWDLHGYARVVVYVKNSLDYQRVEDLEDEHLQTIWIKCGFKNSKHGYYCNGYREHKSNIGGSICNQKQKLDTFINRWEKVLTHGNPEEPNDIFVLCDMNLDS